MIHLVEAWEYALWLLVVVGLEIQVLLLLLLWWRIAKRALATIEPVVHSKCPTCGSDPCQGFSICLTAEPK